jgi:hypothetical protein
MKLNLPPLVLSGNATSVAPEGYWPYDDGSGDPYWEGGSAPRPYRWTIDITIEEQEHSSHLTRVPKTYNAMDIKPNMWVASKNTGIAVKIISVESKTNTSAKLIVEDFFRYNTFRSAVADGIFSIPSSIVVFELNHLGMPVVDPAPSGGFGSTFWSNLLSRFQNFTEGEYIIIDQPNHGFDIDDLISVDTTNNNFVIPSTKNILVGRVVYISSQDSFVMEPLTSSTEFNKLIGEVGDVIYYDPEIDQNVTYETSFPIYVKLKDYTLTNITGTVADASTSATNGIKINGFDVIIGGNGTISDAVTSINSSTADHKVTASQITAPLVVQSTTSYSLGEPAAYVANGPQISINGVVVTFTTSATGQATYGIEAGLEEDMAFDINAANIPDIEAQAENNILKIINTSGGTLELVNVKNDNSGNPILSPDSSTPSCTGIVAGTYGPSTSTYLKLEKDDAGEIILDNVSGNSSDILVDFGIYSVENGIKAKAAYIGQGIRKGEVYSVLDNTQRLSLNVIVGDAAYVEDGGNGEWQYWLYTSSGWELIATQDSARTDADVLSLELTNADSGTHLVGTVSNNSRVTNVTVEVTQAFDDVNSTLNIGDATVNDRLMSEDIIDLTEVGTYTFTPSYVYDDGSDTDLIAYLNTGTSTTGALKIIISYS